MPTDPTSGSVTGVTEESLVSGLRDMATLLASTGDIAFVVDGLFKMAERVESLSAARSVDPLQERVKTMDANMAILVKENGEHRARVRELEEALRKIASYDMGSYDDCPACGAPGDARAALSAPGPPQGEKDG